MAKGFYWGACYGEIKIQIKVERKSFGEQIAIFCIQEKASEEGETRIKEGCRETEGKKASTNPEEGG